jgi:hypothetical protein
VNLTSVSWKTRVPCVGPLPIDLTSEAACRKILDTQPPVCFRKSSWRPLLSGPSERRKAIYDRGKSHCRCGFRGIRHSVKNFSGKLFTAIPALFSGPLTNIAGQIQLRQLKYPIRARQ